MKHLKIANSNRYHRYSKEINLSQTLSKVISNTKISKNLCQADILAFRHYLFAIKNNVQITFDEKESLFRNKNIKFMGYYWKKSVETIENIDDKSQEVSRVGSEIDTESKCEDIAY